MKRKLPASLLFEDDGNLFKSLVLFVLLVLLLIFLFGPCYRFQPVPVPVVISTLPQRHAEVIAHRQARLHKHEHAKKVYLAPAPIPTFLPTPASTPHATPTPPGGGIVHRLAFSSNRADGRYFQLYMMDSNGDHVERLTNSNAFDRDPHFSYDGTCLAFSSNQAGGVYQIFAMDLQTRKVHQLTYGRDDKTNPFWSRDNRQILYTVHRGGYNELNVMSANGNVTCQLTNLQSDSHGYGFSPSGQYISYDSSLKGRDEIFLYNLETGGSVRLVDADALSYRRNPVFSPSGRQLVFCSNIMERKIPQLYIYDLDWKKYYRITNDAVNKDDPIFSPDGTKLAFSGLWENAWNIFVMDLDGKNIRNITQSYYDNVVPTWR